MIWSFVWSSSARRSTPAASPPPRSGSSILCVYHVPLTNNMCICIYIIYIYIYTYICISLSLSLYIYIYISLSLSLSLYIHIYIYTYVYMYQLLPDTLAPGGSGGAPRTCREVLKGPPLRINSESVVWQLLLFKRRPRQNKAGACSKALRSKTNICQTEPLPWINAW